MAIADQLAALPSVLALSASGINLDEASIVSVWDAENACHNVRGRFVRANDNQPFPWTLRFAREQVHLNGLSDTHVDWLQPAADLALAALAPPEAAA